MLRDMERDVGLQELTQSEMDVLLAAHAVTGDPGEAISSDQIRRHDLVSDIAQATFHRALRSLLSLGLLERADGHKARFYVVRGDLVGK
ncbi:hypothetical protein [Silicimonas sp. MF1-12-2]|uniref:hypothetical protein n=1 Tax=Silicimonas sp. MF1-12-2 TaxID=3384793 RepID=UPI0039B4DBE3